MATRTRQLYQPRYVPLTQRRVQAIRRRPLPQIEITPLAEQMHQHYAALLDQVRTLGQAMPHQCQNWGYCSPECVAWQPCPEQHAWARSGRGTWYCTQCHMEQEPMPAGYYTGFVQRGLGWAYAVTVAIILGLGVAAVGGLLP